MSDPQLANLEREILALEREAYHIASRVDPIERQRMPQLEQRQQFLWSSPWLLDQPPGPPSLTFNAMFAEDGSPVSGSTIMVASRTGGATYTATTDGTGTATITGVAPDSYNVTAGNPAPLSYLAGSASILTVAGGDPPATFTVLFGRGATRFDCSAFGTSWSGGWTALKATAIAAGGCSWTGSDGVTRTCGASTTQVSYSIGLGPCLAGRVVIGNFAWTSIGDASDCPAPSGANARLFPGLVQTLAQVNPIKVACSFGYNPVTCDSTSTATIDQH